MSEKHRSFPKFYQHQNNHLVKKGDRGAEFDNSIFQNNLKLKNFNTFQDSQTKNLVWPEE